MKNLNKIFYAAVVIGGLNNYSIFAADASKVSCISGDDYCWVSVPLSSINSKLTASKILGITGSETNAAKMGIFASQGFLTTNSNKFTLSANSGGAAAPTDKLHFSYGYNDAQDQYAAFWNGNMWDSKSNAYSSISVSEGASLAQKVCGDSLNTSSPIKYGNGLTPFSSYPPRDYQTCGILSYLNTGFKFSNTSFDLSSAEKLGKNLDIFSRGNLISCSSAVTQFYLVRHDSLGAEKIYENCLTDNSGDRTQSFTAGNFLPYFSYNVLSKTSKTLGIGMGWSLAGNKGCYPGNLINDRGDKGTANCNTANYPASGFYKPYFSSSDSNGNDILVTSTLFDIGPKQTYWNGAVFSVIGTNDIYFMQYGAAKSPNGQGGEANLPYYGAATSVANAAAGGTSVYKYPSGSVADPHCWKGSAACAATKNMVTKNMINIYNPTGDYRYLNPTDATCKSKSCAGQILNFNTPIANSGASTTLKVNTSGSKKTFTAFVGGVSASAVKDSFSANDSTKVADEAIYLIMNDLEADNYYANYGKYPFYLLKDLGVGTVTAMKAVYNGPNIYLITANTAGEIYKIPVKAAATFPTLGVANKIGTVSSTAGTELQSIFNDPNGNILLGSTSNDLFFSTPQVVNSECNTDSSGVSNISFELKGNFLNSKPPFTDCSADKCKDLTTIWANSLQVSAATTDGPKIYPVTYSSGLYTVKIDKQLSGTSSVNLQLKAPAPLGSVNIMSQPLSCANVVTTVTDCQIDSSFNGSELIDTIKSFTYSTACKNPTSSDAKDPIQKIKFGAKLEGSQNIYAITEATLPSGCDNKLGSNCTVKAQVMPNTVPQPQPYLSTPKQHTYNPYVEMTLKDNSCGKDGGVIYGKYSAQCKVTNSFDTLDAVADNLAGCNLYTNLKTLIFNSSYSTSGKVAGKNYQQLFSTLSLDIVGGSNPQSVSLGRNNLCPSGNHVSGSATLCAKSIQGDLTNVDSVNLTGKYSFDTNTTQTKLSACSVGKFDLKFGATSAQCDYAADNSSVTVYIPWDSANLSEIKYLITQAKAVTKIDYKLELATGSGWGSGYDTLSTVSNVTADIISNYKEYNKVAAQGVKFDLGDMKYCLKDRNLRVVANITYADGSVSSSQTVSVVDCDCTKSNSVPVGLVCSFAQKSSSNGQLNTAGLSALSKAGYKIGMPGQQISDATFGITLNKICPLDGGACIAPIKQTALMPSSRYSNFPPKYSLPVLNSETLYTNIDCGATVSNHWWMLPNLKSTGACAIMPITGLAGGFTINYDVSYLKGGEPTPIVTNCKLPCLPSSQCTQKGCNKANPPTTMLCN